MFLTELHCHTKDASPCASVSAEETVEIYLSAGYSTVVLTNHFNLAVFPQLKLDDSWDAHVENFINAYVQLKRAADGKIDVLFGAELRFPDSANDYLVYGLDENFFYSHRDFDRLSFNEFSPVAHEAGLLIIQAHPFRFGMTLANPVTVDGVEVYNGARNHNSNNEFADIWADKHNFIKCAGSDHHHSVNLPSAGILTEDKPIKTNEELLAVLRSREYLLFKG